MKTLLLSILAALVVAHPSRAAALADELVRKPGQYSLDGKGSTLAIARKPSASWTLEATWRAGDSLSSAAPSNCLRAEGWFVFLERPNRIWIFDGVDGATLLTHSEKELSNTSLSREALASSPRPFRDALPKRILEKRSNSEPAGAPPLPSR